MKKLTLSVTYLLLGGLVMAQSGNTATTTQVGKNHVAEQTQTGDGNTAIIDQKLQGYGYALQNQAGMGNTAEINQNASNADEAWSSHNHAEQYQDGENNTALATQGDGYNMSIQFQSGGSENSSTISQWGSEQYTEIRQEGVTSNEAMAATLGGANNDVYINQVVHGENNSASVSVEGEDNRASIIQGSGYILNAGTGTSTPEESGIFQRGSGNEAEIFQNVGVANRVRINQSTMVGEGVMDNDATVVQQFVNSGRAFINQNSSNNRAEIIQEGVYYEATITQNGSGNGTGFSNNEAYIHQTGGGDYKTATILQNDLNYAEIEQQSSSDNLLTARITQDEGNSANIIQGGILATADITQATENDAEIEQIGYNISATIEQSVDNEASIYQVGLFNSATIKQHINNEAEIEQFDGDQNTATILQNSVSDYAGIIQENGKMNSATIIQNELGADYGGNSATIGQYDQVNSSVTVTQNGMDNSIAIIQNN